MRKRMAALLATAAGMLLTPGLAASASAADFDAAPGTYTADTTALTLTGPGTSFTGTNVGGVHVRRFVATNTGPTGRQLAHYEVGAGRERCRRPSRKRAAIHVHRYSVDRHGAAGVVDNANRAGVIGGIGAG